MEDNIFRADGGEEIDLAFLLFDGGRGASSGGGWFQVDSLFVRFSRAGIFIWEFCAMRNEHKNVVQKPRR